MWQPSCITTNTKYASFAHQIDQCNFGRARRLPATSPYVFHPTTSLRFTPYQLHPWYFISIISSLFIPCILSNTNSNSISHNSFLSRPFHPHLECLLFHLCIFHPTNRKDDMHRMKMQGWIWKYEIDKMKISGWNVYMKCQGMKCSGA